MNEETKIKQIIEILEKYSENIPPERSPIVALNSEKWLWFGDFNTAAKEIVNMNKPKCPKCNTIEIVESTQPREKYHCADCEIHFNL